MLLSELNEDSVSPNVIDFSTFQLPRSKKNFQALELNEDSIQMATYS